MNRVPAPLSPPGLLISYAYYQAYARDLPSFCYRDWVLDSGAYSAHNSGALVDLGKYIRFCQRLTRDATDHRLSEIFSLDDITDWRVSLANTEAMWREGVEAIPAYHYGEPEHVLKTLASTYPKIALGGMKRLRYQEKRRWIGQCFARVWPKRVHGFAVGDERLIMEFPFHSVDSSSYEFGPHRAGVWSAYGGQHIGVRGTKDLLAEVYHYLRLERRARALWWREAELLGEVAGRFPSVRLALGGSSSSLRCFKSESMARLVELEAGEEVS